MQLAIIVVVIVVIVKCSIKEKMVPALKMSSGVGKSSLKAAFHRNDNI